MQRAHGPHPHTFGSLGGVELTGYLPRWYGSRICELANGWRPVKHAGQVLSGAWVTISR
jgi:hypothetical protein